MADELVKAREQLSQIGKKKGVKLSYMPFIIKATSMALSEFPILNSSLDQNKENLIYKVRKKALILYKLFEIILISLLLYFRVPIIFHLQWTLRMV